MTRTHPHIRFIHGSVTGLIPSKDGSYAVAGITYKLANWDEQQPLYATFVVDATGLACRGSRWIESIGYQSPRRDYYDSFGVYSTAVVQLTPQAIAEIPWPKPHNEVAWILAVPCEVGFETWSNYSTRWDGDRSTFILQSTFNDLEPTPKTKAEVYAWTRSLPMEPLQETLLDVMEEEIEEMEIHRCCLGQFYHLRYGLSKKLPQDFVPFGDAIMKPTSWFNPVYGKGGTKACMDVDGVLRRARRGNQAYQPVLKNLASAFLKKRNPRAVSIMDFNNGLDYPWSNTAIHFPGDTPSQGAMLLSWWKQVAVAMAHSDKVYGMVQDLLQGVAPPTQLFGVRERA
ncbi:hypothetical protein FRC01_002741, partial [Tulasnella sp. 417]